MFRYTCPREGNSVFRRKSNEQQMENKPSSNFRMFRPGHNAGDLVEASKWQVLKEERGLVEADAHLPERVLNPRGQLFGGFTGTYVDIISIWTTRTLFDAPEQFRWAATVNMRIDYFAPVVGPRFLLRGELIRDGRSTCLIATHFLDEQQRKLVYAITTIQKNG